MARKEKNEFTRNDKKRKATEKSWDKKIPIDDK